MQKKLLLSAKRKGFGEKTIIEWMSVIRIYLELAKDSFPELQSVFTQPLEDAPIMPLADDLSNFDDVMYDYLRLTTRKTFRGFNQTFSASAIPKVYGGVVGFMNLEKTDASADAIWVNYWEAGAQYTFDTVFSIDMWPHEGTKYCKQESFHDCMRRFIRNLKPLELSISTPYSKIQYDDYTDNYNGLPIEWVNWYPEKLAAKLLQNEPRAIPFEGGTLLTLDDDISCMDDLAFIDEISRLQNLLQPLYRERKQKN